VAGAVVVGTAVDDATESIVGSLHIAGTTVIAGLNEVVGADTAFDWVFSGWVENVVS